MAYKVDKRLFEELAQKEPGQLVLPPFCTYNERDRSYGISAWGGKYIVLPDSAKIEMVEGKEKPHEYFFVFLVNYLLSTKQAKPFGEWLSVKDLSGGVTFFRGPHEVPTQMFTKKYHDDLVLLEKACEKLGGIKLDLADCSYKFDIIGAIQTAVLYWQGDEDFPAEAKILVDKSLADLPLDVVYALLCEVCMRLGN